MWILGDRFSLLQQGPIEACRAENSARFFLFKEKFIEISKRYWMIFLKGMPSDELVGGAPV
ncbi:hypothetical protein HK23_09380 [Acetobacter malorum]|uniref:Uncharacterized protein n=1 Tax=Acetobacter malorum TaxID=178901 RepID=A0A1Y3G933_9PROT|nr:hypothetical protein HK23_09380 [Acetobacter malorum]